MTLSAGGSAAVAPTLTLTDQAGTSIEVLKWEPASEGSSDWIAEYRVMTGLTYDIKITKPGCTSFELTGVPMDGVSSIDLNEQNGETVKLLAGDLDGTGKIDAKDRTILNNNFNKPGTMLTGDLDGTGKIDAKDRTILNNNFNKPSTTIAWPSN